MNAYILEKIREREKSESELQKKNLVCEYHITFQAKTIIKGKKDWTTLNKDLWMELYVWQNEFHLLLWESLDFQAVSGQRAILKGF